MEKWGQNLLKYLFCVLADKPQPIYDTIYASLFKMYLPIMKGHYIANWMKILNVQNPTNSL